MRPHPTLVSLALTLALTSVPVTGNAAPEVAVNAAGDPGIERVVVNGGTTVDALLEARGSYAFPTDVDPGIAPEGDAMLDVAFTTDGGRFLVAQRETNNVTVFDWSTMLPITTIDVGTGPGGIACTDDLAVVACGFSDEVYVIDLDDYSIAGVIPTGEQPWVVRVSPDGARAYVACDIADTCEIIDLGTMSVDTTITGFPIGLLTFSFAGENGRSAFQFSEFELSADGASLYVADFTSAVRQYDAVTGALVDEITGIPNAACVGLSGDGTTLVALDATTDPGAAYQIDLGTNTVTGTATFPAAIATRQVAVNPDGSKCYVGLSGNQSAIGRFATGDAVTFGTTFTAFWIGHTADHQHAIGGQNRFSVVDFDTETLVGQIIGYNQSFGAVSSTGGVASFDPLRNEVIHQFDVSTPSNPTYRGATPAGEAPEGDCPYRAAISPVGTTVVTGNVMSGSATVINGTSVTDILEVGERAKDVAISPDGSTAVVCGQEAHQVAVIDLDAGTVDAIIPTALRPAGVVITPDGGHAYVANIQSNTVSVIELDGAASSEVAEIAVGTIGVVGAAYGTTSGIAMSPTGEYVLVAISFDDNVKVISTTTNTIVATLPTGDFPLSLAFNADGTRALVTNYFSDNVTLLDIDGAGSSVVTTTAVGDGPLRVAYDVAGDAFGVGVYTAKNLVEIDPTSGAITDSQNFGAYGNIFDVGYDDSGIACVLTSASGDIAAAVHIEDVGVIDLPANPSSFAVTPTLIAVPMPGPDFVTLIDWDGPIGTPEVSTLPLGRPFALLAPRPQPASASTHLRFALATTAEVTLRIVDVAGRELDRVAAGAYEAGLHEVTWDATRAPAGVYWATLEADGATVASQRVVVAR